MPNVICQEHRTKVYYEIKRLIETECHYQPLTDYTLVKLLKDNDIYSNSWMLKQVRDDHHIPKWYVRKRNYLQKR